MAALLDISPVDALLDRANYIPTNIVTNGLISETAIARDCFVDQKFSAILQMFLIQYVATVSSYQSIYK